MDIGLTLEVIDRIPRKEISPAIIEKALNLHLAGELRKARARYRAITEKHKRSFLVRYLIELTEVQERGWRDGAPYLDDALSGGNGLSVAYRALGARLLGFDRPSEALRYLMIVESDFRHEASFSLHVGAALADLERYDEAEFWVRQSLKIEPAMAEAYFELGNLYHEQERLDDALTVLQKAVEIKPDYFQALNNLGCVYYKQMRHMDALACFDQCMALNDRDHTVKGRTAMTMLSLGILENGWKLYEYALTTGERAQRVGEIALPRWNGHDLTDKTLLVWREQGVGDDIRFASCYRDLIALGGTIVFLAEPRLVPVFKRSFPGVKFVPQDGTVMEDEGFDYQLPAGSLPLYFRKSIKDFPAQPGFLAPDPAAVEYWKSRLTALSDKPKIGICWRSQINTADNRQHFSDLDLWQPLLQNSGATFVNLQYDSAVEEIAAENRRLGVDIQHFDDLDLRNDLDGVMALVKGLDLVISVGTSVSDMAGAMGTECWTLLMSWCPDLLGTKGLPWYPRTRVFLRNWDDPWRKVMGQVCQALDRQLATAAPTVIFDAPVSRNAPCPCGSGKRYKQCCGAVGSQDTAGIPFDGPMTLSVTGNA